MTNPLRIPGFFGKSAGAPTVTVPADLNLEAFPLRRDAASSRTTSGFGTVESGLQTRLEARSRAIAAASPTVLPNELEDPWLSVPGASLPPAPKAASKPDTKPSAGRTREIIGPTDDRDPVTDAMRASYPYRSICCFIATFPNGTSTLGTGWMAGPRLMMTAGHCVYLHSRGGYAQQVQVVPARGGNDAPFGTFSGSQVIASADWIAGGSAGGIDFGAIILESDVGNQTGWMQIAAASANELQNLGVTLAGYPGGSLLGTMWVDANQILAVTAKKLYYGIDTTGGQSGAPIWVVQNTDRVIVGLHNGYTNGYNVGQRITNNVIQHIQAWQQLS